MWNLKALLCVAVVSALLCTQPVHAAEPPPLSGEQILQKSASAYQALKSYSGTTTVVAIQGYDDGNAITTARVAIDFARPDKIRFDGSSHQGLKTGVISNGQRTWSSREYHRGGAWQEEDTLESALNFTDAPVDLLFLLQGRKLQWDFPWGESDKATVRGQQRVGTADCYEVLTKTRDAKITLWIDNASFLILQLKSELTQQAVKSTNTPKMKSHISLHIFAIKSLDTPLDETLFQNPEAK